MIVSIRILALCGLAALSGCSGTGLNGTAPRSAITHDASGAAVFPGFSIGPPPGIRWVEETPPRLPAADGSQYRIVFRKAAETGRLSILAVVMTKPVPPDFQRRLLPPGARQDFLRMLISGQQEADRNVDGQLRVVWSKYAMDNSMGYDCFRHDSMTEDRGVPGSGGAVSTMDVHAFTCLSPNSEFVAEFGYSQRVPPGAAPADIASEGEAFLRGFRFTD